MSSFSQPDSPAYGRLMLFWGYLVASKLEFNLQKSLMNSIFNVETKQMKQRMNHVFLGLRVCYLWKEGLELDELVVSSCHSTILWIYKLPIV